MNQVMDKIKISTILDKCCVRASERTPACAYVRTYVGQVTYSYKKEFWPNNESIELRRVVGVFDRQQSYNYSFDKEKYLLTQK